MAPKFGNLRNAPTPGAVNTGGLAAAAQKDRVIFLDPDADILYDPDQNVRLHKRMNKGRLINLRLSIERDGQLQSIRVYPLPGVDPSKTKPAYGIAVGHRRVLSCRLTKADDPRIPETPRKIACVVDNDWLALTASAQLLIRLSENRDREDLDFVEEGRGIKQFREKIFEETGKRLTQRELSEIFKVPEKTLALLLFAAEFDGFALDASSEQLITDLDSLVSFDRICKANPKVGELIYKSLKDPEAPRTRSLIRAASAFIEANPGYSGENWSWPETVAAQVKQPTAPAHVAPQPPASQPVAGAEVPHHGGTQPSIPGATENQDAGAATATPNPAVGAVGGSSVDVNTPSQPPVAPTASAPAPATQPVASGGVSPQPHLNGSAHAIAAALPTFIVNVEQEGQKPLSGRLILEKPSKSPSMAWVKFHKDGSDRDDEFPVSKIRIISITHPQ